MRGTMVDMTAFTFPYLTIDFQGLTTFTPSHAYNTLKVSRTLYNVVKGKDGY